MQASFIIPLYNCLALSQDGLRTLQATLPAGLAHEIILVDDGSTDDTRAWLATLPPPCRVVLNEDNLGFAGACNRGAAAARGDLLFFLNNDLIFNPGWFEPIRDAFARFPDAGVVGNVQLNAATGRIDHAGICFNHKGKPAHDTAPPLSARLSGYRRVPAVTGACLALRRGLWTNLGGFDEAFRNGGEDVDLSLRVLAGGRRNYVALRSIIRHHISQSAGRNLRNEQNTCRLVRKWRAQIAGHATRAWSRHYLELRWDGARDANDYGAALALFLFDLGLLRRPPPFAEQGIQTAINAELARWRDLGLL